MTYSYWLPYASDETIGQQEGNLFWWAVPPEEAHATMQDNGPVIAVMDGDEDTWTGDEFWSMVGDMVWDTSRVGQAVPS